MGRLVTLKPGKVTFYPGEPTAWVVDPAGPVIRDLDRRMTRAQTGARAKVGVATGHTLSTIRKQPGFKGTYVHVDVVAGRRGSPVAAIQEFGSAPHDIRPRRRKALRFVQNGHVQFRTRVRHPGTKATHFLTSSLPLAGG